MPKQKTNNGPCSIRNCEKESTEFRRLTNNAVAKASAARTLEEYQYLQLGQQICLAHYMAIVESNRGSQKQEQAPESKDIDEYNNNITSGKFV
jgi:hypothetical protein